MTCLVGGFKLAAVQYIGAIIVLLIIGVIAVAVPPVLIGLGVAALAWWMIKVDRQESRRLQAKAEADLRESEKLNEGD